MQSNVSVLQDQIGLLEDLQNRLQNLRHIPHTLLKVPLTRQNSTAAARTQFQKVRELADIICTKSAQKALSSARESFQADTSDTNPNLRRENRKRRRPPSPESTQPYVATEVKGGRSLLPPAGSDPLEIGGLSGYIQVFNRSHKSKLHLWRQTRGTGQTDQAPVIVRFTIPDILTAYLTLVVSGKGVLLTESLSAFSPRERVRGKSSHTQSDFVVYRNLSQQIARMLQSQPLAAFQSITELLCAYEGLFIERCTSCERVLSSEGHVPPVVRVWTEGKWMARHIGCRV